MLRSLAGLSVLLFALSALSGLLSLSLILLASCLLRLVVISTLGCNVGFKLFVIFGKINGTGACIYNSCSDSASAIVDGHRGCVGAASCNCNSLRLALLRSLLILFGRTLSLALLSRHRGIAETIPLLLLLLLRLLRSFAIASLRLLLRLLRSFTIAFLRCLRLLCSFLRAICPLLISLLTVLRRSLLSLVLSRRLLRSSL